MKKLNPQQMLAYTTDMAERLAEARTKAVFVGLPNEKVGGAVYGNGMTIFQIGATHEYGGGNNPVRSFLRVPFATKRDEINRGILQQFKAIQDGRKVDVALGRVGVQAANISKGAFVSLGYGEWEPITDETKRRKGSRQTLIDTGTLRSSIAWVVRKNG